MGSWHLDLNHMLKEVCSTFAEIAAPGSEFYWPYLLSATGLAFILFCLHRRRNDHVQSTGFLEFCFPKRVYAHRSARLDFRFFVVNTVLYGMFIAPLTLTSATVGNRIIDGLVALYGWPAEPLLSRGLAANLAVTVAVVIVADLGFFVAHYLQHRVAFLWEFHKVHHAAEVLHPVTVTRRHPVDMMVDVTLMGAAAGAVLGIFAYLFGGPLDGVTILGTNSVLFVFRFAGAPLRHSHIRLSFGPFVDRILISPTLHQVHHSCSPCHIDKNFGGILSIWDRLAGTLYLPRDDEELVLGLTSGEHENYTSLIGLYALPFVKNAERLRHHLAGLLSMRHCWRRSHADTRATRLG
jgi:sterol desaturase/sphingolipid hydroxylase (fatty acid hydroxylase superfamily)